MIDILHIKDNFKSHQIQQLLENGRKVVTMYEEILGCKVNKQGSIISSIHPFLGASPDEVVLEEFLVEVERIFHGTVTLKEAVCCRAICEKVSSGLFVPLLSNLNLECTFTEVNFN